jgi:hypothetical protein
LPCRDVLSVVENGGPHQIDLFAWFHGLLGESEIGKRSTPESAASAALLVAVQAARAIADCAAYHREPRDDWARLILRQTIYALEATGRHGQAARRNGRSDELAEGIQLACDLLLTLWQASEDWFRRLRKCRYDKCRKPYFLDRAPAGHATFCSAKHIVAAHVAKKKSKDLPAGRR